MITKPTSLSPSAEAVSIVEEPVEGGGTKRTLTLSAEVLSGSSIEVLEDDANRCYATLILTISGVDYMLVCAPSHESSTVKVVSGDIEYTSNAIRVTFTLDLNSNYYGKIMKTFGTSSFATI